MRHIQRVSMKKAIVSVMLLGGILLSAIIVFVATVADERVVHTKITSIKKITENAALAAAKHYVINENMINAESTSDNIIAQSTLGAEVVDSLLYNWDLVSDPNTVTVTLPTYSQDTFWYRLLDKESFTLENIESQAEIIVDNPISDTSNTLAPLAINNCGRNDLVADAQIDFSFTTSPYYDSADTSSFYAIDTEECGAPAGNSTFSHFKNLFGSGEIDFTDFDAESIEAACLVETSNANPLTVDPMQLYNQLSSFTFPYQMDILMFDCGTTANDLIVTSVISVQIDSLPPLVAGTTSDGFVTNELTISTTIVGSAANVILKY